MLEPHHDPDERTGPTPGADAPQGAHHRPSPAADRALLERALFEVKRVVVGQDHMVERMVVGLVARGHVLLEGVPGVAKTLAVRTLARTVGGSFARLQFTPDLMPGDIVGTRVWRPSAESFDVELGPVFANLVLADEINRAPAKVQSALLEAMAERQVSIAGRTYPLPRPFLVLATQNPIESEGVYQLPEAQRDRFLLQVHVPHPSEAEELTILQRMSVAPPEPERILSLADVETLQAAADDVFVHHAVAQYAVSLVMATREPHRYGLGGLDGVVELGASPRATLGLVAAARALALLRGRDYVLPGDVADVALDVMAHRLVLGFDAVADGIDPRDVVRAVLAAVEPPRVAPSQAPDDTTEVPEGAGRR
ncbi:AAA family ATPase [Phycicoccus flavus]|uniref:AAA family ATPase n=1 Tax=Phycicoccus flavus TaxID=2502783 RepID=UPI000FEBD243|nr:AAA family ATPase [Phycicoccus flavus]NHA66464.1 AAA domain-containing protein [Phycicoccus flavus]